MQWWPEIDSLPSNEIVRKVTPAERLLVVKLEDGLGWEQLCPFIGDKIPEVAYPRGNEPKKWAPDVDDMFTRHWKVAFARWAAVAVAVVIVGSWVWMRF